MRQLCEGLTIVCALLVFFFGIGGASDAAAEQTDERSSLRLIRALHLAATGQCAEAMSIAELLPSRNARAERLIGKLGWGGAVPEFLDLLEGKRDNPIPSGEGARGVAVCEAALESARTGQPKVPESF